MTTQRFFLALCAVSVSAGFSVSGAQARPDFSGQWDPVAERTTPSGAQPALGSKLTIEHSGSAITLTGVAQVTAVVKTADGRDERRTIDRPTTNSYVTDGVEREVPPPPAPAGPAGSGRAMPDLTNSYRAAWTSDQLVVMTFGRATAALASRGPDKVGQLKQVGRLSLSFEADGSLVVDRVTVLDPTDGGSKETPPVSVRTIYRKIQK